MAKIPERGTQVFDLISAPTLSIHDQVAAQELMLTTYALLATHDWPEDYLCLYPDKDSNTRVREARELGVDLEGNHRLLGWFGTTSTIYVNHHRGRHYNVIANLPHEYVTGERIINCVGFDVVKPQAGQLGAIAVNQLVRYFLPGSMVVSSRRDVRLRPARAFREMTQDIQELSSQAEPPPGLRWHVE